MSHHGPRLLAAAAILLAGCSAPIGRGEAPPLGTDGSAPGVPTWRTQVVEPVSAPLTFESPFVHTSVRPVMLRHDFPSNSVFDGGHLTVFAVQARAAITDRIAIIATKDGYARLRPGAGPDENGYLDIGGGLKAILFDDAETGTLVSGGVTYEGYAGDHDVLQGTGNGMWRPFVSGLWAAGDVNVIASVAASLPVDGDAESQSIDYHLHLSPEMDGPVVPLLEINGIHYTNNGRKAAANFEGVDYANLGASKVDGNDIITAALGLRWKASETGHLGFAVETPISQRNDIFGTRYQLDWIQRF